MIISAKIFNIDNRNALNLKMQKLHCINIKELVVIKDLVRMLEIK